MSLIEGRALAQERLLDAAGHVLHAYFKAPQVTGRLDRKAVLVQGDEFSPMLEFLERLQEKLGSEAMKDTFFPMYVDYMCFKTAIGEGQPPLLLVLGADLGAGDLAWDCGACGFERCAEFNQYKKEHGGIGRLGVGPSCTWKSFDFGMACDYACAAAWEMNVENRILGTFGLVSFALGYLDDVTATVALALGPAVEFWWYNRPSLAEWREKEHIGEMFRRNYAIHYQMFSSDLRPAVKQDGAWWDRDPEYLRVETDEEYSEYQARLQGMLMETVLEVRPKVDAMKADLKSGSAGEE
jgi:uncharacterized ferredoxin-like protein